MTMKGFVHLDFTFLRKPSTQELNNETSCPSLSLLIKLSLSWQALVNVTHNLSTFAESKWSQTNIGKISFSAKKTHFNYNGGGLSSSWGDVSV